MSTTYDLAIAGGGLGGAVLAKNMAEHGARVLVVEHERQFKDRVRGEVLLPWGHAEVQALGAGDCFKDAGAHLINWFDVYISTDLANHRDVMTTTSQKLPCLTCYHPAMQESLLKGAAAAGVTVRRGAAVREVRPGAPPAMTVEEDGRVETISARLVVGAGGRSCVVRSSSRFPVQRDLDDMMVAGVLLENIPAAEDTFQGIHNFERGELVVVAPQGGGRARLSLLPRRNATALSGRERSSQIH